MNIPKQYLPVMPYLIVDNASGLLSFANICPEAFPMLPDFFISFL